MRQCPLCGLELDDTDLTRHYLKNSRLSTYIQSQHQEWNPNHGACSRCLETHYRELHSKDNEEEPTRRADEQTIITKASDLISGDDQQTGTACFITIHGADLGKKYDFEGTEIIAGRSEHAEIQINEENVSRQHARIFKDGSEMVVEDLKSTNGTFVNTRKVTKKTLKDGDLILIGNTILKFVSGWNVENRYHEEIYRLATVDGLTHAFNKSFFVDRVTEEFSRSKRYQRDLSILLFDFDHFKKLNDTHGHLAGDRVLKRSASMIMKSMRKEDVVGRYGGEEFGILLPETSADQAIQLAEKTRAQIEEATFTHNKKKFKTTISVGVTWLTSEITSVKQFLELADQALYRAKKDGRNCVRT